MPKVSELPAATGNIDILYGIQDGVSVKLDGGPAYVDVRWFGAVADGVTNDSAAFIAARTAADGKTIRVPAGHYKINAAITGSQDLNIEGDGDATILDFTGTVTGGNYALDAIGTATQIQDLGTNATKGEQTITFASAPSLAVGDVFVIYNPSNSSWSGFRTVYRAGEWCEVAAISGNDVTLRNALYDSYVTTAVDVYKIAGPSVSLRNFQIRGTTVLGLIKATLCINPVFQNITATHANDSIIYLDRCYKASVQNPNLSNVGDGGDDYAIAVGNSQHVRIVGGYCYARRHGITHGGGDLVGAVTVRDSRVIGTTIKNSPASLTQAADFHGNTEDCSFVSCTIYGGALLQGKDNHYEDCTIYSDGGGRCMYHAEVKGGKLGARNCRFITYIDPTTTLRGIYDIGGNSVAVSASTTEDVTFYINDCVVTARNIGVSASFVKFSNEGATVKTNFVIDGLTGDVNDIDFFLRTARTSGTAAADYIVIDRISNFAAGIVLHSNPDGFYIDFPHRCQKQSGKWQGTTTAATEIRSDYINFRYAYPRPPVGMLAISGRTDAEMGLLGGQIPNPQLYRMEATRIRPTVFAAAAFTADATFDVHWSAYLDEI